MHEVLDNKKKTILLGNDAVVRGALESGVQFAATYPGTPASEIGDTFYLIRNANKELKENFHFEYGTNEKVALESAIGANFSGLKTMMSMKHFGVNVAADSLLPLFYTGVPNGMVLAISDDPGCFSSAQSEQNSRAYAYMAHAPMIEPADPQETKDYVKYAYQISEKYNIPVIVRLTTRVSHQRMPVDLDDLKFNKIEADFPKDKPDQFSTMPPYTISQHKELLEKIDKIREQEAEVSEINKMHNEDAGDDMAIIASGVSFHHVMEAQKFMGLNIPVLKLGWFYPLPEKKIKEVLSKFKKILVVEELEDYVEKEVKILAKDYDVEILGKEYLPTAGEIRPENVIEALGSFYPPKKLEVLEEEKELAKRFPGFCPGCPYWFLFNTVKQVAPKNTVFGGDIGCYMMAYFPPFKLQDYLFSMGSGIGIGHGVKKSLNLSGNNQKVIAFIGDSTFFHAGIPALVNCVENKSNPLIIIMDNSITAMTGHQPRPGIDKEPNIEKIVSGIGVKNLKVIDPINQEELKETIKDFLNKEEVSVIISRRCCKFAK
ncbi:MAG: indolepyruvate ferredoxin oxidoreductase subunit alpha [Candidatus Portnoybacteria bacterium]|nr:indolepyruvate ferredoxin oxidoreductase subunit alpha [Candidatus Portnoybacteria bacterium]